MPISSQVESSDMPREIAMRGFYDRVYRFERDMAKRAGQYQADKDHLVSCQNASNRITLQNQATATELDVREQRQQEENNRLVALGATLDVRELQLQQESTRLVDFGATLDVRELQLQQESTRIADLDAEAQEMRPRSTMNHGPRTLTRMWAGFGAAMAILIALDVPWVILNQKYGLYRGHVNGTVTQPVSVGSLWLGILILEALLLSYLSSMAHRWWTALLTNMFAGLVVCGTFNGTSLIMFNTWSWRLAGIDTAWGICLLGLAGMVAYIAGRLWTRTTSNPYVRLVS